MRPKRGYMLGGIARPLVEISRYDYLTLKMCIVNEVAFLFYDAVTDLHSLRYGNHE